jgi:hypothetical protein
MTRSTSEGGLEPRSPLSTQVSSRHHAMLDELYREGMMKTAVVEKGIEMYYAKMVEAGLIDGLLLQGEDLPESAVA